MSVSRNKRGGAKVTKLRFYSVLLVAVLGAFILAYAVPLGMSDGGGI